MLERIEAIFEKLRVSGDTVRPLVTFLTLAGTICVTLCIWRISCQLIKGFRLYVFSQLFPDTEYLKKYGKWALVTGSTDGIGLAIAAELASRGHSIIVVGRSQEKLENTKLCLEMMKNAGEILALKIDLSDSSLANYEKIREKLDPERRDIGILVNNAGMFDSQLAPFHMLDMENIKNMVNVNVLAALHFTKMILPGMIMRKRGLIINVSSGVGEIETAYSSVYGHTKTFINAFSRSLQIEYASKPIDIINLTTGPVLTKIFNSTSNVTSLSLVSTPESYARSSMNAAKTLIPSYSGTLGQALFLQLAILNNKLGLTPHSIKLFLRYAAKKEKVFEAFRQKRDD